VAVQACASVDDGGSVDVTRFRFEIRGTWDGDPLAAGELARIELSIGDALELEIDATDFGDPPPPTPPGRCDGLWNFEVVELFLLGQGDHYLELELGPHGHWLALRLAGRRQVADAALAIEFEARRERGRWHGRARAPLEFLPPGLRAANAYAIHGLGERRRHLAWHPVPGRAPDFHRLELFPALERAQVAEGEADRDGRSAQSRSASSVPTTGTNGKP
jgi:hypothetical protein